MPKSKFLCEFLETEATSWALNFHVIEKILKVLGYPEITKYSNAFKFSRALKFAIVGSLPCFSLLSILTNENPQIRFDSALSLAVGIHVITKVAFLWFLKSKLEKLSKYVIETTSSLGTGNEHCKDIGKKYRLLSTKIMVIAFIAYFLGAIAFNTLPFFATDQWKLPLQSPIYGISYQNHPGYELNYIFVILQFVFCVPPTTIFDILFCLYCSFTVLMFELCKMSCDYIGDKTGEYNTDEKQRQHVIRIMKMNSAAIQFLSEFKEIFGIVILAIILTFMGVCCCLIVQIVANTQISAYFGLCITLLQLFLYSVMGQMIISKKQEFAEAIYCSKWYELKDISTRKMILVMLMNAQKCEGVQLKGFMDLSLETFCQMVKACYTFAAFFMNMM